MSKATHEHIEVEVDELDSAGASPPRAAQPPSPAPKLSVLTALLCGLALGGALSAAALWGLSSPPPHPARGGASTAIQINAEREARWTCSMHPQVQAPSAGLCPICGMDLISAEQSGEPSGEPSGLISLNKRARALAALQTTPVTLEPLSAKPLALWGEVELDDRARSTVSAWVGGRLERLKVARVGERVKRGQVIGALYSPALYQAHQALISALKLKGKRGAEAARRAATERLRLLGVSSAELKQLRRATQPWRRAPLRSDRDGVVLEVLAREGAYVKEGAPLLRVASVDQLWVSLRAPASLLGELREGDRFMITPHRRSGLGAAEATLTLIEPLVSTSGRTARLRLSVSQAGRAPEERLMPGEVVRARRLEPEDLSPPLRLMIPASAPLLSEGGRHLVYVLSPTPMTAEGERYEARFVTLGARVGDRYPVLSGLTRGERVVSRGAFTLDAEAQLRGLVSLMSPPQAPAPKGAASPELSPALRRALRQVMSGYLDLQEQLAESDEARARKAAQRTLKQLSKARRAEPPFSEGSWGAWGALSAVFEHDLKALQDAPDLSAQRASFKALTLVMGRLLDHFGNLTETPLHEASCPMAFEGRGGRWYQRAEEVDNVYYGDQMRRCGQIERVIASGERPAGGRP